MVFTVEVEQESYRRWIGEVPQLPGTLVYGSSPQEAMAIAKALALHVLADRLEHGEADAAPDHIQLCGGVTAWPDVVLARHEGYDPRIPGDITSAEDLSICSMSTTL